MQPENRDSPDPAEQPKEQADRRRGHDGGLSGSSVLIIAAVVIITLTLLALVLYLVESDQGPVSGFTPADNRHLLPNLADRTNEVSRVAVEGQGEKLQFQKEGEGWHLLERSGYPVRDNAIESLLGELGDLRANYVSTQDDPPYEEYGVAESGQSINKAVHVTAQTVEGEALANVTVGHRLSVPGDITRTNVFVRRDRDPRVWLADSDLQPSTDPLSWLWRDIVNVPKTQIADVTTVGTKGQEIVIRKEDSTFHLARGMPGDRDVTAASPHIGALTRAFENVQFNDVRSAEQIVRQGRSAGRASVSTEDGLTYEVQFIENADELWAVFSAEMRNRLVKDVSADGTSPSQTPESDKTDAAARRRVKAFNARHGDWAYLLPNHVVVQLRTRPEDLTQGQR